MKLQSKISTTLLTLAFLAISGCNTDTGITAVNNNPIVVAAPIAANLNLTGLGGAITQRTAANGLLSVGTPNGASANAAVNLATALGGRVTINNDGSFSYQAPLTGNTNDSFQYTLTNSGGSSTATVTIALGAQAFFVKNDVAASGNGQQTTPFKTLAEATTAATGVNGAEIVVFQGDGTSYPGTVNLGTSQVLRGFSQSATPLLAGPIVLSTGNRLEDLRINGTTGSAINATAASNGNLNRLSISNATSAGNLTGATGTWSIANSAMSNLGSFGFASLSSSGNLTWSVSNSSFSNSTTFCQICEQPSGTAVQNLTVQNCALNSAEGIVVRANTTATNVGLTVTNCTVNGANTALRGIDIDVRGTATFTGLLTNNNITACTDFGIQATAGTGSSSVRLKLSGNRTLGNAPNSGVGLGTNGNVNLCAVFQNNVSDAFAFNQNVPSLLGIELFATFASRNTGTVQALGNITDLVSGACGLP